MKPILVTSLDLYEFDRDIDVKRFFLNVHVSFLSEMELTSAIPHTP